MDFWYYSQLVSDVDLKIGALIGKVNNLISQYPMYDKNVETDATLILDYIWLGNCKVALDLNFVTSEHIKNIINVTPTVSNIFPFINYYNFTIHDSEACDIIIMDDIIRCADIIHYSVMKKEAILIHCKKGHHRSACIIAVYLMKYCNMRLLDAIVFIKNKRPTTFARITCMLKTLIIFEAMNKI